MSLIRKSGKASIKNPRVMVLFSHPKTGKTSALMQLEDSLIIDADGSAGYYDGQATEHIKNYKMFVELVGELKSSKMHFKHIVFDTLTNAMSTIIHGRAIMLFNKELEREGEDPVPSNFILESLAYGKGQLFIRQAVKDVIAILSPFCNYLVIVGHTADKAVNKRGETLTVQELALTGKLKNVLAAEVDALGLLHRSDAEANENSISFVHNDGVLGGTRAPHLDGKTILISKKNKNGILETFWDNIYVAE